MTSTNDLNSEAVEHAETCNGLPKFAEDSTGQWTAECSMGDWEVSGCESRAEAGACFYGHRPAQDEIRPLTADDYAALCDVIERAWQRLPVRPGPGEFGHTSDYARQAANRVLDELGMEVVP